MRQPVEYLLKEVDKLYEKKVSGAAIDDHCDFIAAFIRACGYTEEDYIRAYSGQPIDDNKNLD